MALDPFALSGRVAIVTGAGSGIGRGTALVLAGAGATVVCADIDADTATATSKAIADTGGSASAVAVDVSHRDEVHAMVDSAMAAHGRGRRDVQQRRDHRRRVRPRHHRGAARPGAGGQPQGRALRVPGGRRGDAAPGERQHRQHGLGRHRRRPAEPGGLHDRQGRCGADHPHVGPRARSRGGARQRRRPRSGRDGDHPAALRLGRRRRGRGAARRLPRPGAGRPRRCGASGRSTTSAGRCCTWRRTPPGSSPVRSCAPTAARRCRDRRAAVARASPRPVRARRPGSPGPCAVRRRRSSTTPR